LIKGFSDLLHFTGHQSKLDTLLFELFLVALLNFALLLYIVAPLLVGSVTFIEAISDDCDCDISSTGPSVTVHSFTCSHLNKLDDVMYTCIVSVVYWPFNP